MKKEEERGSELESRSVDMKPFEEHRRKIEKTKKAELNLNNLWGASSRTGQTGNGSPEKRRKRLGQKTIQ